MMRVSRRLMIGAGVLVLAAGTAGLVAHADGWRHGGPGGHGEWGGAPEGGPMALFVTFDTDKDGKVTLEEIKGVREARFKQFDANGDGKLGLDEYQALWLDAMRPMMVRQFQRSDPDGDAMITVAEFDGRFERMFTVMDRNGDGAVTRDEIRPPHAFHGPSGHRDRDDDGPGPGKPGGPGPD
jgi:Ca2+-binding EF-hand superfamily protein